MVGHRARSGRARRVWALAVVAAGLTGCGHDEADIDIYAYGLAADGRTLTVSTNRCGLENGRLEATVNGDVVSLVPRADGWSDDRECSARLSVTLDEPLGSRRVIDRSGDEIPIEAGLMPVEPPTG